jgi:hypothetical protein
MFYSHPCRIARGPASLATPVEMDELRASLSTEIEGDGAPSRPWRSLWPGRSRANRTARSEVGEKALREQPSPRLRGLGSDRGGLCPHTERHRHGDDRQDKGHRQECAPWTATPALDGGHPVARRGSAALPALRRHAYKQPEAVAGGLRPVDTTGPACDGPSALRRARPRQGEWGQDSTRPVGFLEPGQIDRVRGHTCYSRGIGTPLLSGGVGWLGALIRSGTT